MGRSLARRTWWSGRVVVLASLLAALVTAFVVTTVAKAPPAVSADGPWVGVWAAAPKASVSPAPSRCPSGPGALSGRTIRNVVTVSAAGDTLRVRLTNVFGSAPVHIRAASVALAGVGAWAQPGSVTALHFGGSRAVTIQPGGERSSDPVHLAVRAGQHLDLSFRPVYSGTLTEHAASLMTNFVSTPGDATASFDGSAFKRRVTCWLVTDGVDVRGSARLTGSVVALGDSITDGYRSSPNRDERWPNVLGRRLAAVKGPTLSVVDEGISGDQLLTSSATGGPSVLDRLDRDVIDQPGVKAVVVLIGINDIGFTGDNRDLVPATPERLERGYTELVDRLHAAGLPVYASPLLPFQNPFPVPAPHYQDAAGERMRESVNRWILTSHTFDGIVDFASVTAQPHHPTRLRTSYDSGDHLHPDDAGYRAMGDAVPLKWFTSIAAGHSALASGTTH